MPKRSQSEIKTIHIDVDPPGRDGWQVELRYHDGKHVSFTVDNGQKGADMLAITTQAIKKQLRGSL